MVGMVTSKRSEAIVNCDVCGWMRREVGTASVPLKSLLEAVDWLSKPFFFSRQEQ